MFMDPLNSIHKPLEGVCGPHGYENEIIKYIPIQCLALWLEKNKNLIKKNRIKCFCFSCCYYRSPKFQGLPFHILSLVLPKSSWCDHIAEPLNPWSLVYRSRKTGK